MSHTVVNKTSIVVYFTFEFILKLNRVFKTRSFQYNGECLDLQYLLGNIANERAFHMDLSISCIANANFQCIISNFWI